MISVTNGLWRCKSCGFAMRTVEYESTAGFCMECRNE